MILGKPLPRLALIFITGYLLIVAAFFSFQRSLLYHPWVSDEKNLLPLADKLGAQPWRDESGTLIGWKLPAQPSSKGLSLESFAPSYPACSESRVTALGRNATSRGPLHPRHLRWNAISERVCLSGSINRIGYQPGTSGTPFLILHGNAGFALHRTTMARRFASEPGVGTLYLMEYPGYGARKGPPSEKDMVEAASRAVLRIGIETGRAPILVGESLGSAVAGQVAGKHPDAVAGLLLITPMFRLHEVAQHHFWFLPTRWILREKYDNASALATFTKPVALVGAGSDEVVPLDQAKKLLEHLPGPKRLWVVDGATHNTLDYDPGSEPWSEVCRFLALSPTQKINAETQRRRDEE
jgi:uncharacterized protein